MSRGDLTETEWRVLKGLLPINRAIATRYGQLANSFLGMVHLATARYRLKFAHAA